MNSPCSLFLLCLSFFLLWTPLTAATDGVCAIYGNCGKKSLFGSPLPCATGNSLPYPPSTNDIEILTRICGKQFTSQPVCCLSEQIKALESNLKRVDPLIASCPACQRNFYDFFCQFSCSPNQSNFVQVTKSETAPDTKLEIVTELTQYVDYKYAEAFYDSCKNIKFLATNGFAMDLIGGGATNARQFLKFLGDEKPLLGGSPFQMNFEYSVSPEHLANYTLRNDGAFACDDPKYKCACSDCSKSCPKLPHFRDYHKSCKIGPLPCFSFMILLVLLCLVVVGAGYHVYIRKQRTQEDLVDLHPDLVLPMRRRRSSSISLGATSLKTAGSRLLASLLGTVTSEIELVFEKLGHLCASKPSLTVFTTLAVASLLCVPIKHIEFETDPIGLWVSPSEPALLQKQYFESKFGKFYRIEQLIISPSGNSEIAGVLSWDVVQWWFEREAQLQKLGGHELSDLCFKPLGETCAIESFTQYFQGDINYLTPQTWKQKLVSCTNSPVNCLPTFQQPLKKSLLFSSDEHENVLDASAFVVTILLNNVDETQEAAESYERAFVDWVENELKPSAAPLNLSVAYLTESSLERELNKSSNTDITTIVISYVIMFIYASLALGGSDSIGSSSIKEFFVNTRFQLGLGGIAIIFLSIFSSAGICVVLGFKSTLIIMEVIPFLVLAVGIDNIFLIVNELKVVSAENKSMELERRVALCLKKIGPSCFILALLQFTMFLIASLVDMPAVKNFALYSAGAILMNFLFQVTTFIALLTFDQRRIEEGRLDVFWWKVKLISLPEESEEGSSKSNWLSEFISTKYSPFIFDLPKKRKLLSFFIVWFGISLSLIPNISYGLDQRIALPSDSYLVEYFNSVYSYLNVGPPVFFVTRDLDVTKRDNQQKVCGKFSTCDDFSISNILQQEYKRGTKSLIAEPAAVWLDDFLNWLNPDLDQCCRFEKTSLNKGDQNPEFCSVFAPERQCQACYEGHSPPFSIDMRSFPEDKDFMFYFNQWIEQPSDPCPLGGKAPYSSSISVNTNRSKIDASYFRTSHKPLRSQQDFIVAYKNSLRIVNEMKSLNKHESDNDDDDDDELDIFAYSPFYVFFVQYETIFQLTALLLGSAGIVIFLVNSILLGSLWVSVVVLLAVTMIIVNILGVMALWGISLNAVSVVNLVICVGFAVEFTIHTAKAFIKAGDGHVSTEGGLNPSKRAEMALNSVGPSIFSGITMTKIIGISILAFTKSKIFEVYYFRMWFALVIIAAVHGLCLLPILLSYCRVV